MAVAVAASLAAAVTVAVAASGPSSVGAGGLRVAHPPKGVELKDIRVSVRDDVPRPEGLLSGPIYEISGPQPELPGPIEIRLDAPQGDWLAYHDDTFDLWIPVETHREGRTLVASSDHLSFWSSMKSGFDWLALQLYRLTGTRTEPPTCAGNQPSWVTQFFQEPGSHSRLLTCIGGSDDKATVSVKNNRGYPLWVTFTNASGSAAPDVQNELELGYRELLELAYGAGWGNGRSYVGPGKRLDATFAQPTGGSATGTIEVHANLDQGIVAFHIILEVLDHFDVVGLPINDRTKLGATAVECWLKVPWNAAKLGEQGEFFSSLQELLRCLRGTVDQEIERLTAFVTLRDPGPLEPPRVR